MGGEGAKALEPGDYSFCWHKANASDHLATRASCRVVRRIGFMPTAPRLRAAGGGKCVRDTGPAEDREQAEEDGAEMIAQWTKEQSPGGGPGVEDSGTAGR